MSSPLKLRTGSLRSGQAEKASPTREISSLLNIASPAAAVRAKSRAEGLKAGLWLFKMPHRLSNREPFVQSVGNGRTTERVCLSYGTSEIDKLASRDCARSMLLTG